LHEGLGKDRKLLYPAMPYQWYTKVTRDDVLAIKAYLFSLPPSQQKNRETKLRFPFDVRAGLAVWNAAYFKPGEFKPDPAKPADVNHGAYLVEGLAHCGDCHTPRGFAMETLNAKSYSGGVVDNWYAPNITSDKTRGIGSWPNDELLSYLKTGLYKDKGPIVGPMGQVVHESLSYLSDQDLNAIVAYLRNLKPIADYQPERVAAVSEAHSAGATAYLGHCAFCHGRDGKGRAGAIPALEGNDLVNGKGPESIIRVVLGGLIARGAYAPMPAVGQEMSDQDVADAVNFARNAWSNNSPPTAESGLVAKIRAETNGILAEKSSANDANDSCRSGDDGTPVPPVKDANGELEGALGKIDEVNMLQSVSTLIKSTRKLAPKASQAEIINGLTQAYCRAQFKAGIGGKADGVRLLNQFSQLIYAELVSPQLAAAQSISMGQAPQTQATPSPAVVTPTSQPETKPHYALQHRPVHRHLRRGRWR
jgi:mono/diheme cytochrome c family protein